VINLLDLVLLLDPNHTRAEKLLALAEKKRRERQIDSLNQAGALALRKKDYLEAMAIFARILELDPDNHIAQQNRDQALAIALKEMAIRTEVLGKVRQALSYYSGGNYKKALRLFTEVQMIDPENKVVIKYIEEIKRKRMGQIRLIVARARRYIKRGQSERARYILNEGRRRFPDSPALKDLYHKIASERSLLDRAIRLYENGKHKEAAEIFWQVISINPKNKTASSYLSRMGAKKDPEKYHTLGVKAYISGNLEQAIRYWEMVLEIDPKNQEAMRNIERAKRKLAKLTSGH
jgi:tetratricopeptide (TPR) repeat protein